MTLVKIICISMLLFISIVKCEEENSNESENTVAPKDVEIIAYTEEKFKENVEQQAHFIMFYAPWCGHCQRLKPIWEELVKQVSEDDELDVALAKVDCTTETKLCSDEDVLGYPTLKFYHPEKDPIRHKGARDLKGLKEFIKTSLFSEPVDESAVTAENGLFELSSDNFDDHISSSKHFIMFYAPWCGHCKRLEPTWQELANLYQPEDDTVAVKIGRVDCTKERTVCSKHNVRGYPTLLWFEDGKMVEQYQSGRDLESLKNFIKKMTDVEEADTESSDDGVGDETVPIEDGVYVLNDSNFADHTSKGFHFIVFYAPWCGHCKRLMPNWNKLGQSNQLAGEQSGGVKIGKVDCTDNHKTCSEFGVRGYPTILWFKDGENVKKYQSGRDLESLQNFIATMTSSEDEEVQAEEEKSAQPPPPGVEKKEEDDAPDGPVMELNESDFDFHTALDVTFVKFYAPWCGFCQRLAPTWEELAVEDFSELQQEVKIAKIDCTKYSSVCQQYKVTGYPTLILFQNGEKIAHYSGNRSKEDLKSFVIETANEETANVKEEL